MDGGLKSMGSIENQEGDKSAGSVYCFRLRIRNKNSWFICADTEDERDRFM